MRKRKNIFSYKLLLYDIKYGFNSRIVRFFTTLIILLIIYALTQLDKSEFSIQNKNNIINFLYGVDYNSNGSFSIPFKWLLINLIIANLFIDYFKTDFEERGNIIFTRISRSKYYIIKSISLFINILIFYTVLFTFLIVFNIPNNIRYTTELFYIFILYSLTSFALLLLYNSVSVIIDNKIGLLLFSISLFGVIPFDTPFIIGQHSIVARHIPFSKYTYLSNIESIYFIIIFIFIIIIFNYIFIKTILVDKKRRNYEKIFSDK